MAAPAGGGASPPTLFTISREAGVHPSTVSRALSDDPTVYESVASHTRTTVKEIAERLGYRRNRAGASLRTGRSGVLGVLVPRITDIVVALAYEGLDEAARAAGYITLVASSLDDPANRAEQLDQLLAYNVDAVLFSDGQLDDADPPERSVPVLPFLRTSGARAGAAVDDRGGGRLAARHLLDLGHQDILVLAGPPYASTARDRVGGFVEELASAGVELDAARIAETPFDVAGGRHGAASVFEDGSRPTAVFAVNDFTAIGAIGAARATGLSIPADVSIMGFNDIPIAAELPVALTSIRSPLRDVGAAAARAAISAISGESTDPLPVFPTELTVRESTGPSR